MSKKILSYIFYLVLPFVYLNATLLLGVWVFHYFPPILNGICTMLVLPISLYMIFWWLEQRLRGAFIEQPETPFGCLLILASFFPIFFNASGFGDYWNIRNQRILLSPSITQAQSEDFSTVAFVQLEDVDLIQESYGYHRQTSASKNADHTTRTTHHQIVVPIAMKGKSTRFFAHQRYTDKEPAILLSKDLQLDPIVYAWIEHDPYRLKTCNKAFNDYKNKSNTTVQNPIFIRLTRKNYTQALEKKKNHFFIYIGFMNGLSLLVVLFLFGRRNKHLEKKTEPLEKSGEDV